MKILIAHNTYQYRGGEDTVVDAESALLRGHGHAVELYSRSNEELQTMSRPQAAIATVWSHRSAAELDRLCEAFRPDLIHVHNTFPLISPSLYWAAARRKIPLVQTLHNFRLLCPQAMLFREGTVCEDCIGKVPWRAMTRKCYRGSALQSAVAVGMLAAHRALGTYRHHVDCYIVLNAFCRDKFIEGGLPPERLRIKPNFVQPFPPPRQSRRRGGLFVGRLSHEKGIHVLIDVAAMLNGAMLRVIGTGPLEGVVREAFERDYLGFMDPERVHAHMGSAEFLVVPSIGVETFGLVVVEAFACGTPVIASRLGGLGNLVRDGVTGLLVEPGNARDLAAKIAWAHAHPEQMLAMGRAAREEYEANFTPERNYQMLMRIYEDAIVGAKEMPCIA
jgi:glycosyltransferase involved in cell wall biosynthesis